MKQYYFVVLVVLLSFCSILKAEFELRFTAEIENTSEITFAGTYAVSGQQGQGVEFPDTSLLAPPLPPGRDYVEAKIVAETTERIRDTRTYDPNAVNLLYSISLSVHDANSVGLTGTSVLRLLNPESLLDTPADCMVYLRRFDAAGTFVQSYDLTHSANHIIQWEVAAVSGQFAQIDVLLVDKCLAADLFVSDFIDFQDFAILANQWQQAGSSLTADIFKDEYVNLSDLSVLMEKWLCGCE